MLFTMSDVQLLDQLLHLTAILQADQERELAALGLTAGRTHVMWIVHHSGPAMQRDIATAMGVTPRHVTTLVDELLEAGLATRQPHPHDRRAVLVALSERGTSLMEQMALDHDHLDAALSAELSTADLASLQVALHSVTARLQAEIDAAATSEEKSA